MADKEYYEKVAAISREIAKRSQDLVELSKDNKTFKKSELDGDTFIQSDESRQIDEIIQLLLSLTAELKRELSSPTNFLEELVACNWDKGALYCLLEHNILELLPKTGTVSLTELAEKTAIPPEKLLPILRLSVCNEILQEPINERFQHSIMSECLVNDSGLKAFIGFQLYETRAASVHLSDSLKRPNPTWTGKSAFRHAFPASKDYEYFISQSFPGMICQNYLFPEKLEDFNPPLCTSNEACIYIFNTILWILPDEDCVLILRSMAEILEKSKSSMLLINDLLSPPPGADSSFFDSDKAYRRRDVTVMTMHNAKVRTLKEWQAIFLQANPRFKLVANEYLAPQVGHTTSWSAHSCRGLWELKLGSSESDESDSDRGEVE
ncbi:hypothetical protein BGZ63DRAFT_471766 [Mariannaea sp. PMI_226]|nr:hypothetical protein BGZ63DRAFT_471766 [Mariannaea sp. PMI_226]